MKILKITLALSIAFGFLFTANSYAQAPNILWQKSLGGTSTEKVSQIIEVTGNKNVTPGGYVVVGVTQSTDGDLTGVNTQCVDYWVVRLSSAGNIIWHRTLGGFPAFSIVSIQQTNDHGYIVAGNNYVQSTHVYWVIKLAPDTGTSTPPAIQWQKTFGGSTAAHWDIATSIKQTSDNGFIVAGYSNSNNGDLTVNHGGYDYWVVKLAPDTGTSTPPAIQWQKSLGGTGDDIAYSIQQTSDGGYIVAGESISNDGDVTGHIGSYDYWVVKLSPTTGTTPPTIQWQKILGGTGDDRAYSIQQTSDGGYVVAGHSRSTSNEYNFLVVKLSPTTGTTPPTTQWQKTLGGTGDDHGQSIQQTSDGGYIVAGDSNSISSGVTGNHGQLDCWVVKLSPTTGTTPPTIQWEKSLGGTLIETINSVRQTSDGGYIVAGYSNSNDDDVTGNHGGDDYWVVKLDADLTTGINDVVANDKSVNVYPNPTTGKFTVKLDGLTEPIVTIYNSAGQGLMSTNKLSSDSVDFDLSNNTKGTYIIKIQSGKKTITKKVIVR